MVIIVVRGRLSMPGFVYSLSLFPPLCLLCAFLFTFPLKTDSTFTCLDTPQSDFAIHLFKHIYKLPTMCQVSPRC